MSCLSSIGPNQLIIIDALISLAISDDFSADDLNILGNFIAAAGALILTKAAQLSAQNSKNNAKQQLQDLEEQIDRIKRSLRN
jgi:hypothetical protein